MIVKEIDTQEYQDRARMKDNFAKEISDHLGNMFAFPNLLFEAIQLPPLSEIEARALEERSQSASQK